MKPTLHAAVIEGLNEIARRMPCAPFAKNFEGELMRAILSITIIACFCVITLIGPAIAAPKRDRSAALLACAAKAIKTLPARPKQDDHIDRHLAYEDRLGEAMEPCLLIAEVEARGLATGVINIAEDICGGNFTPLAQRTEEPSLAALRRSMSCLQGISKCAIPEFFQFIACQTRTPG